MKVGDLVSIKANIGLEDSEWGKAGLVLRVYRTARLDGDPGHPVCDIHFADSGELRLCMSQGLFKVLNEAR